MGGGGGSGGIDKFLTGAKQDYVTAAMKTDSSVCSIILRY